MKPKLDIVLPSVLTICRFEKIDLTKCYSFNSKQGYFNMFKPFFFNFIAILVPYPDCIDMYKYIYYSIPICPVIMEWFDTFMEFVLCYAFTLHNIEFVIMHNIIGVRFFVLFYVFFWLNVLWNSNRASIDKLEWVSLDLPLFVSP